MLPAPRRAIRPHWAGPARSRSVRRSCSRPEPRSRRGPRSSSERRRSSRRGGPWLLRRFSSRRGEPSRRSAPPRFAPPRPAFLAPPALGGPERRPSPDRGASLRRDDFGGPERRAPGFLSLRPRRGASLDMAGDPTGRSTDTVGPKRTQAPPKRGLR